MSLSPRRMLGAVVAATLLAGLAQVPVIASPEASTAGAVPRIDADTGLDDLDLRGRLLPTAAQTSAASSLGGLVRWNRFGTPASISKPEGNLGAASSSNAVTAAGAWLGSHADLFGRRLPRSAGSTWSAASPGRQRRPRGAPPPGLRRPLTRDRRHGDRRCRRRRDPVRLLLARPLDGDLGAGRDALGDRRLAEGGRRRRPGGEQHHDLRGHDQAGLDPVQGRRLRPGPAVPGRDRLALADGSVRPVFEANVVDAQGGSATAYTSLVDAVTGKVLVRHNQDAPANDLVPVPGHRHRHRLRAQAPVRGQGRQQQVHRRHRGRGREHQRHRGQDLRPGRRPADLQRHRAPAPRWRRTAPTRSLRASTRCRSARSRTRPCRSPRRRLRRLRGHLRPGRHHRRRRGAYPPKWDYFLANPTLDYSPTTAPTNRVTGCWVTSNQGTRVPGCDTPPGALENFAARAPWDVDVRTGLPTFTTVGNAANTHEAWVSPLTPGGTAQAPVSPTRAYDDAFTDAWNNSKCDPTQLHPGGNDINAVVTNLFVAHNRMHDWSYCARLHREELQPAEQQLRQRRPEPRERPGAGQRPGRRRLRWCTVRPGSRQRQPDRAAGRCPGHHQPVPLPADRRCVLLALRRRRARHERRRPRVHPRDQQPHDRRPRPGDHLRAGRCDGRVLGRPGRGGVHVRQRLLDGREPVGGRAVRDRQQHHRHPRLRDQRQPAELLRLRLRLHR